MARQIIDISMPLENEVRSDPPGYGPQIEYITHKDSAKDVVKFFPWKERYASGEKPKGHLLKKSFNALRRVQFPWTYDVHRDATAQPFADLQQAFVNFWKGKAAYPTFKKKGKCRDSFYVANDKFHLDGKSVTLPKVGAVKMRESLRFDGKILGATVSREASRWSISIQVQLPDGYCRERSERTRRD